jgi:CheY-like chemotaxis protein
MVLIGSIHGDIMKDDKKKTVLVADDEVAIRDVLKLHLEKGGYNVILSEDGEEAIDALKCNDISLALTDIRMPKVDGFGVLEYVNEHRNHIPVILLTGYVDVQTAVEAMKKGSVDYLTKPIRKNELLSAVDRALKGYDPSSRPEPFEPAEIYLLKNDGMVLYHHALATLSGMDSDLFGSMFTAIKMFIRDSFHQNQEELKTIEHGRFKILIEEGSNFFIVVIGQGEEIKPMRETMKSIVRNVNSNFGDMIANWVGFNEELQGIEEEFRVFTDK